MHLTQALHKARREQPDRTAVVCGSRRASYAELGARVERVAGMLQALGVQAGDRVAVLSPNTDRFLELCYGCWWAGAILMPVNCRWSNEEIAYALNDSGAAVLLVDDPFAALMTPLKGLATGISVAVYLGENEVPDGALGYVPLLANAQAAPDARRQGNDPAVLFYTGGTTGRAKGVLLSHGGLYTTTLASITTANRAPGAICLHALPMFHVGGLAVVLQAMVGQGTQVMLPAFDPLAFLDLIVRERVAEAGLVPTMIKRVVDCPALAAHDLSSLQRLYYGASPIDATLLEQALACLPGVALTQFYGMTETSGIAVALPAWCHSDASRARGRHLAAGFATACMELRIAGPTGTDQPVGQVGEVYLRGPGVMLGYWNLPEQTDQALVDGWMRTGDSGYVDADGLLYIVDRIKDMVVSGGENVYSTEVENCILSLPGVLQCAVIGIPDPDWGERVHAVLVLKAGSSVDARKVIDHCKRLIAGYKCPRSVEFREELPLSGAGKLLKFKLREPFWAGHARRVG